VDPRFAERLDAFVLEVPERDRFAREGVAPAQEEAVSAEQRARVAARQHRVEREQVVAVHQRAQSFGGAGRREVEGPRVAAQRGECGVAAERRVVDEAVLHRASEDRGPGRVIEGRARCARGGFERARRRGASAQRKGGGEQCGGA
jgi:hypothetical protein